MANIKRLTRRVEEMEEWVAENSNSDTMANYNYLLSSVRQAGDMLRNEQENHQNFKNMVFEWMSDREHGEDWNAFIKEKDDALQEPETEETVEEDSVPDEKE